MTLYLGSQRQGQHVFTGDGALGGGRTEPPIRRTDFTYDPMNPVPSYGGNVCCTGNAVHRRRAGPTEDGGACRHFGVHVRTAAEGLEVSGSMDATLYVSSDAKDTDYHHQGAGRAYPDGTAYNLDETIQRLRYRDGYDKPLVVDGARQGVQGRPATDDHQQLLRSRPPHSDRSHPAATFRRFDRNHEYWRK
jgi:predicted acyl esterase